MALAVLSAVALIAVVVAAIYLIAGAGGNGGESVVGATSTPTRRPVASPTASRTPIPATPSPGVTQSPSPKPSPSPVPGTPRPSTGFFLWNSKTGTWQDTDLAQGASDYSEGDSVVFLYKLGNVTRGETYEFSIDYFDCGLSPGRSFDFLSSTSPAGDTPSLTAPGPGRARPDSQVPVPDDPAITVDGATPAQLAVWGGSFQRTPQLSPATGSCPRDQQLTVRVLAQSSTLYFEWAGHLATATDWFGAGAASADSPFGMSATLQGADEARVQVLPGAVAR